MRPPAFDSYRYGAEGQAIRAELFDAETRGDRDAVRECEETASRLAFRRGLRCVTKPCSKCIT
jgi:hypothetical protein